MGVQIPPPAPIKTIYYAITRQGLLARYSLWAFAHDRTDYLLLTRMLARARTLPARVPNRSCRGPARMADHDGRLPDRNAALGRTPCVGNARARPTPVARRRPARRTRVRRRLTGPHRPLSPPAPSSFPASVSAPRAGSGQASGFSRHGPSGGPRFREGAPGRSRYSLPSRLPGAPPNPSGRTAPASPGGRRPCRSCLPRSRSGRTPTRHSRPPAGISCRRTPAPGARGSRGEARRACSPGPRRRYAR